MIVPRVPLRVGLPRLPGHDGLGVLRRDGAPAESSRAPHPSHDMILKDSALPRRS